MKRVIFIIVSLISFSSFSAQLTLEPYGGIVSGNTEGNDPSSKADDFKIKGESYGGKVGFSAGGLSLGGVYDVAKTTATNEADSTITAEYEYESYGVYLSFNMTYVGIYAQYYPRTTLTYGNFTGTGSPLYNALLSGSKFKGKGGALGVTLGSSKWLRGYLQVQAFKYDSFTWNGTKYTTEDAGSAFFQFGVSIPLSMGTAKR